MKTLHQLAEIAGIPYRGVGDRALAEILLRNERWWKGLSGAKAAAAFQLAGNLAAGMPELRDKFRRAQSTVRMRAVENQKHVSMEPEIGFDAMGPTGHVPGTRGPSKERVRAVPAGRVEERGGKEFRRDLYLDQLRKRLGVPSGRKDLEDVMAAIDRQVKRRKGTAFELLKNKGQVKGLIEALERYRAARSLTAADQEWAENVQRYVLDRQADAAGRSVGVGPRGGVREVSAQLGRAKAFSGGGSEFAPAGVGDAAKYREWLRAEFGDPKTSPREREKWFRENRGKAKLFFALVYAQDEGKLGVPEWAKAEARAYRMGVNRARLAESFPAEFATVVPTSGRIDPAKIAMDPKLPAEVRASAAARLVAKLRANNKVAEAAAAESRQPSQVVMPFGAYKGFLLGQLKGHYLMMLLSSDEMRFRYVKFYRELDRFVGTAAGREKIERYGSDSERMSQADLMRFGEAGDPVVVSWMEQQREGYAVTDSHGEVKKVPGMRGPVHVTYKEDYRARRRSERHRGRPGQVQDEEYFESRDRAELLRTVNWARERGRKFLEPLPGRRARGMKKVVDPETGEVTQVPKKAKSPMYPEWDPWRGRVVWKRGDGYGPLRRAVREAVAGEEQKALEEADWVLKARRFTAAQERGLFLPPEELAMRARELVKSQFEGQQVRRKKARASGPREGLEDWELMQQNYHVRVSQAVSVRELEEIEKEVEEQFGWKNLEIQDQIEERVAEETLRGRLTGRKNLLGSQKKSL